MTFRTLPDVQHCRDEEINTTDPRIWTDFCGTFYYDAHLTSISRGEYAKEVQPRGYDWKGNLLHSGCLLPKGSLPEIHHGKAWFLLAMSTDSYISSPANFCRLEHHIEAFKDMVYFPYPLLIKLEPAIYIPRWASVDREAKSKPTPFFTSYLNGVPLALNAGHR